MLKETGQEGSGRFQDGQRITVCGVVSASKTKTTKNNTLMAYVTVEDDTGSIELLCFSRTLEQSGAYLKEGLAVAVRGKLSLREDKPPQILCDSAVLLESALPDAAAAPVGGKKQTLYLKFPSLTSPELRHMKRVFTMFPGKDVVKLVMADSRKVLQGYLGLHDALLSECREVLGAENVVLK